MLWQQDDGKYFGRHSTVMLMENLLTEQGKLKINGGKKSQVIGEKLLTTD